MPDKVLFIQTAFLGDLFLSIPLLKKIKEKYPNARLALLCKKGLGEFFLKTKLVDEVFEVNKSDKVSLKEAFLKTKMFSPQLIISAHQSIRTALWVWRLGAKERIGFSNIISGWAYTKKIKRDLAKHDVLRQLSLVESTGSEQADMFVQVDSNHDYDKFKDFVAVAPGSQWATKRWNEEGFVRLIKKLQVINKQVVLIGGPDEKDVASRIKEKIPQVIDLVGSTTVFQLAQLLKNASALISNDSGAMHVASAVGVPVVSIFGPTTPAQGYAPWVKKNVIVEATLSCRPCGAHGHDKCPIGTHECMKLISAEKVFDGAMAVLK